MKWVGEEFVKLFLLLLDKMRNLFVVGEEFIWGGVDMKVVWEVYIRVTNVVAW